MTTPSLPVPTIDDVLADLAAEYACLDALLASLTEEQWAAPSAAPGWTVRDVMVHLAQTEGGVASTLALPVNEWTHRDRPLDDVLHDQVAADTTTAQETLHWWRRVCRDSVAALRQADPDVLVRWAAAPLRPKTLATTRLAEHWAHALDVAEGLGLPYPDTDRLHHIAWLGHATLPYARRLAGQEPCAVRAELTAPSGAIWTFGPEDAPNRVRGTASAFCRVGARRLDATEAGFELTGPDAAAAMAVLRNYAA